jgi:hypothetical protein
MTPAETALRYRRQAIGAERAADREAAKDNPWTDRNVRAWQSVMTRAWALRRAVIVGYMHRRALRRCRVA